MLTVLTAKTKHPRSSNVNETLVIDLDSEYKIKEIEGLGPVKAEISTVANSSEAGSQYLSSRDVERNIVITVGFEPNYASGSTVTSLRRALMDVFMPKFHVYLELDVEGMGTMLIDGRVESHVPNIFSEAPTVQISIICPYPYFTLKGEAPTVYTLPQGTDILSFDVPFDGLIPVGFLYEVTLTQDWTSDVSLMTGNMGEYLQVQGPFLAGDVIRFSTVRGDRYVHKQSAGDWQKINLLGFFNGSLSSMKLYPGINHFDSGPAITTAHRFTYQKVYGGI